MENKEIIINGVDVSKCESFLKDSESYDYNEEKFIKGCCEVYASHMNGELMDYGICINHPDCYYKKLARKTAECKRYEQALNEILQFTDLSIAYICFKCKKLEECSECIAIKIKDIITKAKDANNG